MSGSLHNISDPPRLSAQGPHTHMISMAYGIRPPCVYPESTGCRWGLEAGKPQGQGRHMWGCISAKPLGTLRLWFLLPDPRWVGLASQPPSQLGLIPSASLGDPVQSYLFCTQAVLSLLEGGKEKGAPLHSKKLLPSAHSGLTPSWPSGLLTSTPAPGGLNPPFSHSTGPQKQ